MTYQISYVALDGGQLFGQLIHITLSRPVKEGKLLLDQNKPATHAAVDLGNYDATLKYLSYEGSYVGRASTLLITEN